MKKVQMLERHEEPKGPATVIYPKGGLITVADDLADKLIKLKRARPFTEKLDKPIAVKKSKAPKAAPSKAEPQAPTPTEKTATKETDAPEAPTEKSNR